MLHLLYVLFTRALVLPCRCIRFPTLLTFYDFFMDFFFKRVKQILIFCYNFIDLLIQIVSFVYNRFLLYIDYHWIALRLIDESVESTVTNQVHWVIGICSIEQTRVKGGELLAGLTLSWRCQLTLYFEQNSASAKGESLVIWKVQILRVLNIVIIYQDCVRTLLRECFIIKFFRRHQSNIWIIVIILNNWH